MSAQCARRTVKSDHAHHFQAQLTPNIGTEAAGDSPVYSFRFILNMMTLVTKHSTAPKKRTTPWESGE